MIKLFVHMPTTYNRFMYNTDKERWGIMVAGIVDISFHYSRTYPSGRLSPRLLKLNVRASEALISS